MGLSSLFKKKITDEWRKEAPVSTGIALPAAFTGKYEGEISEETVKILFVPEKVEKINGKSKIAIGEMKIGSIDKETGFFVLKPDGRLEYTMCKAFAIDNKEVESVKSGDKCTLLIDLVTNVEIEKDDKIVEFISPDAAQIDDLVMPEEFKKFK